MKEDNNPQYKPMTPEQREAMFRIFGLGFALLGKALLKEGGCVVDFKINGEDISDIEKLHKLDITEKIELAIREERYEDAGKLKKLLDKKNTDNLNK